MKEIYVVHSCGSTVCAYVNYYAALDHVLSTIAELTGEPYTGSTEDELNEYLYNNCDAADIEKVNLHDD